MDYLLLVRHSLPEVKPEIFPAQWELSQVGRQRTEKLAGILKAYAPTTVITSEEPKAVQTGAIVAGDLGIPVSAVQGLHEHQRDGITEMDHKDFEKLLAAFFTQPANLILGHETAGQALRRFSKAMTDVMNRYPAQTIIVVAHGTVITLWTANLTGGDPFLFWKRLGMPSIVVFSRPNLKLVELVEHVE